MKYRLLIYWLAAILGFILSMHLFLSGFRKDIPVIHTIMERDIDPSALFYSESDVPVRAERQLGKVIREKRKDISPDE